MTSNDSESFDHILDPLVKQLLEDYASGALSRASRQAEQDNTLKNLKRDFQTRLITTRDIRKLSQTQLAERLGISQTAISRIENGNPSLKQLIKYLKGLDYQLTLSDIIGETKQENLWKERS